jgi:hypothetical protein
MSAPGERRVRFAMVMLALAGPLALAGCQHGKARPLPPGPPTVTSGSTLQVTAPFVIPRGAKGVYFQDTELRAAPDLQRELPYCYFQLGPVAAAARTIGPQAFTVTGVEYDEQAEGAAGAFGSVTYLNLQSGPQQGPQRLTCLLPGDAQSARFVTPAEISGALGGYFKLSVAP